MSDPGLLQKQPDIPALLSKGGGGGEQPAEAERALCELEAMDKFCLNHQLE